MDYTKKTIFAGFVNIAKGNKYWVDGHYEYSEDVPTLFNFNTREEKAIVQDVAQSYLDNWGFESVELVIFEVKSRHAVMLKKRSESEKEQARKKVQDEAVLRRSEVETAVAQTVSEENPTAPKKRGRKPKQTATI